MNQLNHKKATSISGLQTSSALLGFARIHWRWPRKDQRLHQLTKTIDIRRTKNLKLSFVQFDEVLNEKYLTVDQIDSIQDCTRLHLQQTRAED